MTSQRLLLSVFLLAFASLAAIAAADEPLPTPPTIPDFAKNVPQVKEGEPIQLFDGKDLDGWYTFLHNHKYEDPDHVFSVKDGQLVISGQEFGGITTKKTYGNYHLITEWKWGEKQWVMTEPKSLTRPKGCARDAGILVHGTGKDDGAFGHWLGSIECQVIEGGVGDFLCVPGSDKPPTLTVECILKQEGKARQWWFHPGGKAHTNNGFARFNWWGRDPTWTDTSGWRDKFGVEKPHGEWNRQEVICDGDSITQVLNGYLVNHGTKCNRTEGKIQLQSEGAEIIFRKVELRPLIK